MSPMSLRRLRAERLLAQEFEALRAKVLAAVRRRLAAAGAQPEAADLEACYAQAWQGLYAAVAAGQEIANPAGWLVVVAQRRAIEETRLRRNAAGADGAEVEQRGSEPDLAARLDDLSRLRHLFEAMRSRLSRRECEAASLCYLQGLSRADAAERMGVSVQRMRKLMDGDGARREGVASKVGKLLTLVGSGGWCDEQASLMRALAFGVLDPAGERYRLATQHQRECAACRRYVLSLRGLAAVLPPLVLPPGVFAGAAGAGAAGAGAGSGSGAGAGGGAAAGGAGGGSWGALGGALGGKLAGALGALGIAGVAVGGAALLPAARPALTRAAAPATAQAGSEAPRQTVTQSIAAGAAPDKARAGAAHVHGEPTAGTAGTALAETSGAPGPVRARLEGSGAAPRQAPIPRRVRPTPPRQTPEFSFE